MRVEYSIKNNIFKFSKKKRNCNFWKYFDFLRIYMYASLKDEIFYLRSTQVSSFIALPWGQFYSHAYIDKRDSNTRKLT